MTRKPTSNQGADLSGEGEPPAVERPRPMDAPPPPGGGIGVDAALERMRFEFEAIREPALKAVEDARAVLQKAEDDLAKIDRVYAAFEGKRGAHIGIMVKSAPAKPRAARKPGKDAAGALVGIRGDIHALLVKNPKGLKAGEIIANLGGTGDTSKTTAIRNALANMKKAGEVVSVEGQYSAV